MHKLCLLRQCHRLDNILFVLCEKEEASTLASRLVFLATI